MARATGRLELRHLRGRRLVDSGSRRTDGHLRQVADNRAEEQGGARADQKADERPTPSSLIDNRQSAIGNEIDNRQSKSSIANQQSVNRQSSFANRQSG